MTYQLYYIWSPDEATRSPSPNVGKNIVARKIPVLKIVRYRKLDIDLPFLWANIFISCKSIICFVDADEARISKVGLNDWTINGRGLRLATRIMMRHWSCFFGSYTAPEGKM